MAGAAVVAGASVVSVPGAVVPGAAVVEVVASPPQAVNSRATITIGISQEGFLMVSPFLPGVHAGPLCIMHKEPGQRRLVRHISRIDLLSTRFGRDLADAI